MFEHVLCSVHGSLLSVSVCCVLMFLVEYAFSHYVHHAAESCRCYTDDMRHSVFSTTFCCCCCCFCLFRSMIIIAVVQSFFFSFRCCCFRFSVVLYLDFLLVQLLALTYTHAKYTKSIQYLIIWSSLLFFFALFLVYGKKNRLNAYSFPCIIESKESYVYEISYLFAHK